MSIVPSSTAGRTRADAKGMGERHRRRLTWGAPRPARQPRSWGEWGVRVAVPPLILVPYMLVLNAVLSVPPFLGVILVLGGIVYLVNVIVMLRRGARQGWRWPPD